MTEAERPGKQLIEAREQQQLSQLEVANKLKLSASIVKAIEAEDYDRLPGVAFVRGYVRNYAKLVGFSAEKVDKLVADYEKNMTPHKKGMGEVNVAPQPTTNRPKWWVLIWLLVLILIVYQGYNMWQGSDKKTTSEKDTTPAAEAVEKDSSKEPSEDTDKKASDTDDEDKTSQDDADEAAEEDSSSSADSGVEIDMVDLTPSKKSEASEDDEDAKESDDADDESSDDDDAVADEDEDADEQDGDLVVSFSGECWLRVQDNTGETLFTGIKNDGDTLSLDGEAPYSFRFGNGGAVDTVTVAGEEVELPERQSGQVLNFSTAQ